MTRISLTLLFLAVLATLASATVPSFCKCTCFQNSTIIPLGPQHDNNNNNQQPAPPPSSNPTNPDGDDDVDGTKPGQRGTRTFLFHLLAPRSSSTSCKQCNRAFCLKYNLPICKDAEEKDIKTSCFQRDSPKDRVIVWGFIVGTAGLLGWAALRRVIDSARERGQQGGLRGMSGRAGRHGSLGGMANGGRGDNGRGLRTGTVDNRAAYDPLEDGHDEGVTRGPG
ncbi:hypothetical protein VTG60DRAFT_4136 [Thermothelomyces hinnuleus]